MLKKFTNKKGFTLMEMLIVVAIIAVLVAIAIPTFNNQLEKSREATDAANIRALYAEQMVEYLNRGAATSGTYTITQKTAGWENNELEAGLKKLVKTPADDYKGTPTNGKTCTVAIDDNGKVTITFATT